MTRERRRKVVLVGLGVVALLAARSAVVTKKAAGALEARWPGLVAERREAERQLRVPVVRGAPREGNAAPRYLDLLPRIDPELRDDWWELNVPGDPFAPVESATLAALGSHASVLADLREVLRFDRCDWETSYDLPLGERTRPFALHALGKLLLADGHQRAQAGDAAGAAACYLDVVRLRADLGRARPALSEAAPALEALARLVTSDLSVGLDLDALEAELDRALAAFPAPADELALLRLEVLGALLRAEAAPDAATSLGLELPRWADHPLMGQVLTLSALRDFDARWDAAERALRAGDVEALAVDREAIHHHDWGQGSLFRLPALNPIALAMDASLVVEVHDEHLRRRALGALIHAACALERAHRTGAPAAAPPLDPFTGAPLSVELRPDGYRLSSPGRPRPGCCSGPTLSAFVRRW